MTQRVLRQTSCQGTAKGRRHPSWKKTKPWPSQVKLRIIRRLIRRARRRPEAAPILSTDVEQMCSICLVPVDARASLTPNCCEHIFHFDCIDGWSKQGDHRCPLCKRDYSKYNRITLFGHWEEIEVGHRKKYDSDSSYDDDSDYFQD